MIYQPRAGNYGLKRTPRIFHWIFVDYYGLLWNIGILRNIIGLFWIIGILRKIVENFGLLWNIIGLLDFSRTRRLH